MISRAPLFYMVFAMVSCMPDPLNVNINININGKSASNGGSGLEGSAEVDDDENDCVRNWMDEKTDNPPLISIVDGKVIFPTMENNEKKIRIGNGVEVVFACSKTEFEDSEDPTIHATCKEGKLLDNENKEITWEKLKCKVMIKPSITKCEPKTVEEIRDQHTCIKNKGVLWTYGFEIGETEKPPFHTMIYVCFDKENKRTVFTVNKIHGRSMSARYNKKGDPNIDWVLPPKDNLFSPMDDLNKFDSMFRFEPQGKYFEQVLGLSGIISKDKYFNQGHMAPRSDFITKAEQVATYNYINALPQYNKINSENWVTIEHEIDELAKKGMTTLTIVTFGYETPLVIKSEEIYIGNEDDRDHNKRLPVPKCISKIVKEVETTFLSYNNEYESNPPCSCPDQTSGNCDDKNFDWLSDKARNELRKRERGLILCCKN